MGFSHILNEEREEGFSLVELLVVIVIIGILSAIAIGAFMTQRQKANDAAVQSDMRTVVTSIETALVDDPNATNISVITDDSTDVATIRFQGEVVDTVHLSEGVDVRTQAVQGAPVPTANGYILVGHHPNGHKYHENTAGIRLVYNSATGGFVN